MKIILAPARTPRVKRSQPADLVQASPRHRRSRARLIVALGAVTALTGSSLVYAPDVQPAPQPALASTLTPAASTQPGVANFAALESDDPAPGEPDERRGIPTIESIDGSNLNPHDPELATALEQVEVDQAALRTERDERIGPDPDEAQAGIGGLTVVYLTEPPAEVRAVVDAAAARWAAVLETSPAGPVEIEFDWRILPPNVLGLAAPTVFNRNPSLPTSAYYPVALANTLLGVDLAPDRSEITISLASNLADSPTGWYINASPTTSVPARQIDLFTVVVHEIGHGLGFTGSGRNGRLESTPLVYDLLARYEGQPVVGSGRVTEALTSNNLFIDIGGGRTAALFAPSSFINQVSFSHFDESPDPTTPGGLMTPAFGDGELNRTIDAATLGVMAGIGWPVAVPAVQPRITEVVGGTGSVSVSFTNDLGRVGLPPTSHTVVVRTVGAGVPTELSATVGWADDSVVLSGVPNGVPIQVSVTANAPSGASAPAITTGRSRPSTVAVSGVGTTRTIRWRQPGQATADSPIYVVERRVIGGGWNEIGRSTNTLLTDDALSPGVYQYRVRAEYLSGESESAFSTLVGVADSPIRPMELDGQLGRLYFAFLGRQPDASGMSFWLRRRAEGESITSIANQFAASPEFQALLGETDDGRFVDAVYASVLGRPADVEGRAFWVAQLSAGTTRGELMIRFSETPEFVNRTGTVAVSGNSGGVARLYWAFLQRPPEVGGLGFWTAQLGGGTPLTEIADGFAASDEFTSTYGSLTDDEFIDVVYDNVLGRRAGDAAFQFWRAQLAAGTSRGSVMFAFSNSPEFILTTGTLP